MGDLTVTWHAVEMGDLTVTWHAVEMGDLTVTWHAMEMGDLTVTWHAVEMGDLTVGGYEDGGAMPLCDVVRNEKVTSTNDHYTQTEDILCNPRNPVNPDSERHDTVTNYK